MGKESEMANPHKAPGQHVQEEPSQEFVERQRYQALLVRVSGIVRAGTAYRAEELGDAEHWFHGV